ncbi:hypothetical protein SUGI_0514350 [Cryptomeria japonica]|nr:hypothetical protein SUGI_0514350 [Cryptomeria japonica]
MREVGIASMGQTCYEVLYMVDAIGQLKEYDGSNKEHKNIFTVEADKEMSRQIDDSKNTTHVYEVGDSVIGNVVLLSVEDWSTSNEVMGKCIIPLTTILKRLDYKTLNSRWYIIENYSLVHPKTTKKEIMHQVVNIPGLEKLSTDYLAMVDALLEEGILL